jgi:hypothetical protein
MPCRCDYMEEDGSKVLKRAADAATRAACDMRTILRREGLEDELTAETRQWIKQHDAEDAARIAQETAIGLRAKTRRSALSKLSLEERRVLGL